MSKCVVVFVCSIVLLSLVGPAAADLGNDPALVVYYSYDEFDDVVPDLSGKGHNGTVEGDVTFVADAWHDGVAKFATGSYLDLDGPDFPSEDIPTKGMTLAAWGNCENTGGDHAIFNARSSDGTWVVHPQFNGGGNFRWLLRAAGGTTIFDIRAGSVDWDEWMHFAGTYDQATGAVGLYIDGQAVNQQTISNPAEISGDWGQGARVGYNIDNARPFTGMMDDFCIFKRALSAEEILAIMAGLGERGPAFDPIPEDEMTDVVRSTALSWSAGPWAATHDVYLGTSFDDVNDASSADPTDVLASEGQEATSYQPGLLEFNQTYYWRVDEVNAAPDDTIFKGTVWSFTTEPFAYPIQNIVATSNLDSEAESGPEKSVDGSGLNAADEHSTTPADMWLGSPAGEEPMWIQYAFGRPYKLHEIIVWNYNTEFEMILGFGIREITVEYSTDGVDWTSLTDVELAQATAMSTYAANTTIDGGGVEAQYVRFIIHSSYGGMGQYGLSEVRFMYIPVQARDPEPADGAVDVAVDTELTWRAGREAVTHDIYLGTDAAVVSDETALADATTINLYAPDTLDYGAIYYWKVDEVNEAEAVAIWAGDLWSFSTQEYGLIEGFESYDDDQNRIYDTWIDGWVNKTGSTVGYMTEPFAERKIVHGGKQSLPLAYDNSEAPFYSETSRTWSTAQDLMVGGADSLRLYVRGLADNTPETLYVALEDGAGQIVAVPYSDADAVVATDWIGWTIPYSEFDGVDLTNVKVVHIGVGNPDNPQADGAGLIYVDDIGIGHSMTE